MSASDVLPGAGDEHPPPAGTEAATAVLTAVGCLLLGAPVGLLWAALAPRVTVTATADGVQVPDPTSSAFVATDGVFVALVLLAGLATGVVAVLLSPRSHLGRAVGLTLGGLAAAEVARRTGPLVGRDEAEALLAAADGVAVHLPPRLRSTQPAVVLWALAALAVSTTFAAWPLARAWWRGRTA